MQKVALSSGIGEAELLLDSSGPFGPFCGPESKKRGDREMRRARIVENRIGGLSLPPSLRIYSFPSRRSWPVTLPS